MTKTILIVEDEAQTRDIFLRSLAFENFKGIGAENGLAGIELACHHRPDLIVCDIMMPDVNGFDVLSALRRNDATRAIPFIFLTAKSSMADLRQGMTSGADDYLTKPCTVEQFLEAIAARLHRQAEIAANGSATSDQRSSASPNSSLNNSANSYENVCARSIFPPHPKLRAAFTFIEDHYRDPISLCDVARAAGYSSAYLTHLAQRHTGRTIKGWILERRMVRARKLLVSTAQPIESIAIAVGFTDAGYFTRQFRKLHETTPRAWRRQGTHQSQ